MDKHSFIFTPGEWLGEGIIKFSASDIELHYYTKWTVKKEENGTILCIQKVEVTGAEESVENQFRISHLQPATFQITLENEMVGKTSGTGVIDPKRIAWEFRGIPGFEGFEIYEFQDNGEYLMHAEYLAEEDYRTHIKGKIWKKAKSST